MASTHVTLADQVVALLNDGLAPLLDNAAERRVLPADKITDQRVFVFVGPARREIVTRGAYAVEAVVYVVLQKPLTSGLAETDEADALIELSELLIDKIAAANLAAGSLQTIDDDTDAETYFAASLKERGVFTRTITLRFEL